MACSRINLRHTLRVGFDICGRLEQLRNRIADSRACRRGSRVELSRAKPVRSNIGQCLRWLALGFAPTSRFQESHDFEERPHRPRAFLVRGANGGRNQNHRVVFELGPTVGTGVSVVEVTELGVTARTAKSIHDGDKFARANRRCSSHAGRESSSCRDSIPSRSVYPIPP